MKQSAVEWLIKQIEEKNNGVSNGMTYPSIFEKAKEMEDKQEGYSEEDVLRLLVKRELFLESYDMSNEYEDANEWFKKFKK